jgi:hypothetical protein
MPTPAFDVKVSANPATGKVHAVYLRVSQGQVEETREVQPGRVLADYDAGGNLLGVELLGPCRVDTLLAIFQSEPDPVRQFVTGAAPRELVPA